MLAEIIAIQAECAAWFEALPESRRDTFQRLGRLRRGGRPGLFEDAATVSGSVRRRAPHPGTAHPRLADRSWRGPGGDPRQTHEPGRMGLSYSRT